jgi:hypothetical protein
MRSVFFRTVEHLINMQYQYVSQRNVPATMEIIQSVTAFSATILDTIIDGVETTLYTVAYLSFGIWMQRCKHTWWNPLSGIACCSLQNAICCMCCHECGTSLPYAASLNMKGGTQKTLLHVAEQHFNVM